MTTIARGTERPWTRILIAAAVLFVALVGLRLAGALNVAAPTEDPILGSAYSISVPAGWEDFQVPGTWAPGEAPSGRGPGSDVYSSPGRAAERAELNIWSQALPAGTTLEAFLGDYDAILARNAAESCQPLSSSSGSIAGTNARLAAYHCTDVHEAVVIHRDRAYSIGLTAPLERLADEDRAQLFEAILATFAFTD